MAGSILSSDSGFISAKMALDGLSLREQAISRNIANVDTPGYQAQTVNFESAIKTALKKTEGLALKQSSSGHLAAPAQSAGFERVNRPASTLRADQNNVDIDAELTEMTDTALRYQTVSQTVSKKLVLLKAIAMGR